MNVNATRASPVGLVLKIRPGWPTSFIAATSPLITAAIVVGVDESMSICGTRGGESRTLENYIRHNPQPFILCHCLFAPVVV